MRAIFLTRAGIALPIVAYLNRRGAPVDRLLAKAGLPSWIFSDPEALVPTISLVRFLDTAARTKGFADLGLMAGHEASLDALGVLGWLIERGPTLGDALNAHIRHHRAYSSDSRIWLADDGDDAKICHQLLIDFDETWCQAVHYAMSLLLKIVRLGAGPTWRPSKIELQTAEVPSLRTAEPLAGVEVVFGQPATAITFPRALLDAPLRPLPPSSSGLEQGLEALHASAPADEFAGSIVQVVQTLAWGGYPHISLTSSVLGLSVRTLQRRLAVAGLTHESIVGRARFETATVLLRATDGKILDIALNLGYSDHAHFTRAFHRWAGCSPQEYRRRSRYAVAAPGIDSPPPPQTTTGL